MRLNQATSGTVLDALLAALRQAGEYNRNDQIAPAAILWTDKDRQWEPLAPRLREAVPHFLTLGPYVPGAGDRTGPAIWLRCMIDRTLPDANWPPEMPPILYLPGVSRQELRAVEECPRPLQPLAELQYRGVFFTQLNGKDWTVAAFLGSEKGGLGLDLASDRATAEAMLQALTKLADTPVAELRRGRLEAADFQALLRPDLVKDLLRWMDSPDATRAAWTSEEWAVFSGACRQSYGFDPERDGELAGAEKLGQRDRNWPPVWTRFVEAPAAYPHLPDLLRRAKPKREDPLFFKRDSWPQCNEAAEDELRAQLAALGVLAPDAAAVQIEQLESAHSKRRAWVWAALGRAPLASALEPLAHLARATRKKLSGGTLVAMAETYISEGWQADAAAIDAVASVSSNADAEAVKAAVTAIYRPWLQDGAERFQQLVREAPPPAYGNLPTDFAAATPGTCVLFADGLRFDLGRRVQAALVEAGFSVQPEWRWVPNPSVTPTAKPAASPVADLLGGGGAADQFTPSVRDSGQELTIARFRQLLEQRGFQDLRAHETGDPSGRAWTEYGEIDRRGHDEGWKLVRRIREEVRGLAERITMLFEAGWREIRVVTDHGWLLLPGGLPKEEMPAYLVESRWTRCAALKPGARVEGPTTAWFWNPDVQIATAPGIGSFKAGTEYSHGGLSLQECVVPVLTVTEAEAAARSGLEDPVWVGMRCRVRVSSPGPGLHVDLRSKTADPKSSLAGGGKELTETGEASLVVADDRLEGDAANLVLLDAKGSVVARRPTTVGGS